MKLRKIKLDIISSGHGNYGFEYPFYDGLNIIKGHNSSGKSTLVNVLIYSLGMEEIIGSKGVASLPYALKSHFVDSEDEIRILESTVYIELENSNGVINTFKRAITSINKDSKLVEVIHGPYLTCADDSEFRVQPTFIHDGGSAQDVNKGFFAYFENYLGLDLPKVVDSKGKESQLYLQSIFAALIIEQKRGWTDYVANIPYYGVTGMREKVISYLLDLDVFKNSKSLNDYTAKRQRVISKWSETASSIKLLLETNHLSISGLTSAPSMDFDKKLISIGELVNQGEEQKTLAEVKELYYQQIENITGRSEISKTQAPEKIVEEIETIQNRIEDLLVLQEICGKRIRVNESQYTQYKSSLNNIAKDLKDNQRDKKLADFGASINLPIAQGICGTCLQTIDDILIKPESESIPMTIEENITHLDNQKKMVANLMKGVDREIEHDKAQMMTIVKELVLKRKLLTSLSRDVKSINSVNEADIRQQIILEQRYSSISLVQEKVYEYLDELVELSKKFREYNSKVKELSRSGLSSMDWKKVQRFESAFIKLASDFRYRSAPVNKISVKPDTMLPYLNDLLELREQIETPTEAKSSSKVADVKTDSSASDFVRLIWAYLMAIYKTSDELNGNHPKFIVFDEPAQHSMSLESLNEMLKQLANSGSLQSIVAASFDQSELTFKESTQGVNFHTITLPSKVIVKQV
jgi:hypothetical protein